LIVQRQWWARIPAFVMPLMRTAMGES
jgi:hypothetical protein